MGNIPAGGPVCSGLKGLDSIAQGNALGSEAKRNEALKGRNQTRRSEEE
jgi:hypothetical protein